MKSEPVAGKTIKIWAPDPLEKIFRETPCPKNPLGIVDLHAARGETVSGQIALRTKNVKMHGYGVDTVAIGPLRRAGNRRDAPISVERRWVGYTFVGTPASGVESANLEGKPPGLYPDPLYPVCETSTHPHHFNPDHSATLGLNRTQALWLTVRVPSSAAAGVYEGTVSFRISYYGTEINIPVRLTVYNAGLPAKPVCGMVNWFVLASVVRHHQCAWWSERFWELTEAYLRNMAGHRQTHIVVPMFELIEFKAGINGGLKLGWERFDRFIRLALKSGLTELVGNHLATYTYHLHNGINCGVHAFRAKGGKVHHELHAGRTPEARAWLEWFLPILRRHLKDCGWLHHWWQPIRDEPSQDMVADYLAIHAVLKQYAPEFRTMEALHGPVVSQCDCWVPCLNSWGQSLDFFKQRQVAGDNIWTYVCCGPTGRYANRFIDQKTILPRLIFWIMFRYGATGYLHWGYNWSAEQVSEIDTRWFLPAQGPVPSGDVTIVYPGPHGPHDSIRWEMQREGVQDYELLCMLARKAPLKAEQIAGDLIKGFDSYNTSTSSFRAARQTLLKTLERC
jgi:hypothetical protein